jgi:hypothetical protein
MRPELHAELLLTLWEAAVGQPASARGEALLRSVENVERPRTLGEQNAKLIALHARLFCRKMELLSYCRACGSVAQFTADCEVLAAKMQPKLDAASQHQLKAHAHHVEFRLPDTADIEAASAEAGDDGFAQRLLERCVLACTHDGNHVPVHQVPGPVLDALSQRMETLDPGASVSFDLQCPQCAAQWQAALDVAHVVWQKVQAAAERVLLDVDVLARAYGWTEREVLRLSPLRRAAYLQMVTA